MAEKVESQADRDRKRELARRAAQKDAVKRAQAESIISHGPVKA